MQQLNEVRQQETEPTILEGSKKFARAIGESPQFQQYEGTTQRMRNDREAQRLLSELQEAEQTLQMTQSWGGASDEDTKRFEHLRESVLSNPTLKAHFEAQDNLVQTLKELNVFISDKVGFDFANLAKPAGGCC